MTGFTDSTDVRKGLEGVVAGETRISKVDGANCELVYRGYNIDELVGRVPYEEAAYLLFRGALPVKAQLTEWEDDLRTNRKLDPRIQDTLAQLPKGTDPMAGLQAAVTLLGIYDRDAENESMDAICRKIVTTMAKIPTIVALLARVQQGLEPVEPEEKLSHAANFLYMLHGKEPNELEVQALDAYLVLLADHGFNASTFAARVVTGTRSDYYSAITAAIGTLKGPLHGAAARWAMEMLQSIGSTDEVENFVQKTLAERKRFMGFGHRVYKGEDPRAKHLKRSAQLLSQAAGDTSLLDVCERLQKLVLEAKSLYVNVDFYSAPLLHHLGIPTEYFTALFATSRVAGWSSHVVEQVSDNRLIRPLGRYTGTRGLQFVPINQREASSGSVA